MAAIIPAAPPPMIKTRFIENPFRESGEWRVES
jgi:hypothetical protein